MADQLPIISKNRAVNTFAPVSSSLVGRGLAAIKCKEISFVRAKQDSRYWQARDIYNRITDYGEERHFNPDLLPKAAELLETNKLPQLQSVLKRLQQLFKVFEVFQQLANQGYGKAYFLLANIYQGGQGISQNLEKADYYSHLAFDWCVSNQALNDSEIWRNLGIMYGSGHGVAKDEKQALFWIRKAAEQGHANAQYNLAWLYESGQGIAQDDAQAVFWYRKAAEQGVVNAQWLLAGSYRNGYGVIQNFSQAMFWYQKAAEQNHALAQWFLGGMYAKGLGVKQDPEQAVFWYRKAATQGCNSAQEHLAQLGIDWLVG